MAEVEEGLSTDWRRYERLLAADERERYERFRFQRDARTYLVAHVLLRTTLSRYANVRPEDWRFGAGAFGRPHIVGPDKNGCALSFNLSHTRGLVGCVVASRADCGIDVEQIGRVGEVMEVARSCFAPAEIAELERLEDGERAIRFCEYWTLKEAYLKARGVGLGLSLDVVRFSIDAGKVGAHFAAAAGDREEDWQFQLSRPTAGHVLAVAVRRTGGRECIIRPQFTVPLGQ
jgi:4'-phosphopantetheinyl transferase